MSNTKASQLREKAKKAEEALKHKKSQESRQNNEPLTPEDKERVKAAYTKDIISLEIIKTQEKFETQKEAEEYYDARVNHKIYLIDDLAQNYFIRLSYTDVKKEISSVDPEHIEEGDQYELSETIQEILRENLFPVIKSNFPEGGDSA